MITLKKDFLQPKQPYKISYLFLPNNMPKTIADGSYESSLIIDLYGYKNHTLWTNISMNNYDNLNFKIDIINYIDRNPLSNGTIPYWTLELTENENNFNYITTFGLYTDLLKYNFGHIYFNIYNNSGEQILFTGYLLSTT